MAVGVVVLGGAGSAGAGYTMERVAMELKVEVVDELLLVVVLYCCVGGNMIEPMVLKLDVGMAFGEKVAVVDMVAMVAAMVVVIVVAV